jgi:hypothetical protein
MCYLVSDLKIFPAMPATRRGANYNIAVSRIKYAHEIAEFHVTGVALKTTAP